MKFSMKGQEKDALFIKVTTWAGLAVFSNYFLPFSTTIYNTFKYLKFCHFKNIILDKSPINLMKVPFEELLPSIS
jgi:hypothetical protein